ncbi:MAG TPA: hypothetical protein VME18_12170 [Acidobacteriaceae bacterium]|nr:hypothetical protein [Acidobacteriaceae bacterium]
MKHGAVLLMTAGVAALLALTCGFASQPRPAAAATQPVPNIAIIFTAAPVYDSLVALRGGERFPRGAELMLLRDGHITPLVSELAASADASVSFDGKTVLFAGKKNVDDPWQIWKMALDGGQPQLALAAQTDLIRPMWMPDGRMVYARREPSGFTLETAALDGSQTLKLSYVPGNFIPDNVLRDGRVLFESGFPLGAGAKPEIYTVYADGSGEEAVRCDHAEAQRAGGREHGRQMPSGDIVFVQADRLERFTSALANETPIAAPPGDYAGDVTALPDGRWLLTVRRPGEHRYELAVWRPAAAARFPGDPEARSAAPGLTTVARDDHRDLIQPVLVAPRTVPNRHPSGLHPWTTGNLMALDARLSRSGELHIAPARVRVESLSPTGSVVVLGIAPVAQDGSFFVKAAADRPLRFVLLDARGRVLRQEHGWFWVRRGEQRVCVGCHTGPEHAPNNRLPGILLLSTTPANAAGTADLPRTGGH